ncbi:hypothetical protein EX30DRAFT_54958 [Ascodesmis nigricans]|uniref:Transmembrane protein n=1 Tax=Ascodesmis nigricans TaxID=341454 RepID=A0A4S2MVE3_9PEZI|nr:hypothetical protein EX30DRAFT_54958 [Ascodesmis nigricans]
MLMNSQFDSLGVSGPGGLNPNHPPKGPLESSIQRVHGQKKRVQWKFRFFFFFPFSSSAVVVGWRSSGCCCSWVGITNRILNRSWRVILSFFFFSFLFHLALSLSLISISTSISLLCRSHVSSASCWDSCERLDMLNLMMLVVMMSSGHRGRRPKIYVPYGLAPRSASRFGLGWVGLGAVLIYSSPILYYTLHCTIVVLYAVCCRL